MKLFNYYINSVDFYTFKVAVKSIFLVFAMFFLLSFLKIVLYKNTPDLSPCHFDCVGKVNLQHIFVSGYRVRKGAVSNTIVLHFDLR